MTPELEKIKETNKDIYDAIVSELHLQGFEFGERLKILLNELVKVKDRVDRLESQVNTMSTMPDDLVTRVKNLEQSINLLGVC